MKKIVYPGTFDPITLGHLNLIERISKNVDEVVVLILENNAKENLFTVEKRIEFIEKAVAYLPNVKVEYTETYLSNYLQIHNLNFVMRGLRTVTDYHYEIQMALNNRMLMPEMEIIFLVTENKYSHISSSTVRELLHFKASIKDCVPENIISSVTQEYEKIISNKK